MCFDPISYDKAEKARKHSKNVQEQLNVDIINILENSNFKKGTMNWVVYSGNLEVSEGWLYRTYNATAGVCGNIGYSINLNVTNGDKYYVAVNMKYLTEHNMDLVYGGVGLKPNATYGLDNYQLILYEKDKPYFISDILTAGSHHFLTFGFKFPESAQVKIGINKPILVNLTETFGKGNEPTKDELDKALSMLDENWWEGQLNHLKPILFLKEVSNNRKVQNSKFYILDDITGIYDKPKNLESVGSGDTLNLEETNHLDIYNLYDSLMNSYPNYITKKDLGVVSSGEHIYEYTLSPPEIKNLSIYEGNKIKILMTSALHGYEQGSAWCLYQFIKDLCENQENKEVLKFIKRHVEIKIIPVANPYGYDNNQRTNVNGVDIEGNFRANWILSGEPGPFSNYRGPEPLSEMESQILESFIENNKDANLLIDVHNVASGYPLYYVNDGAGVNIASGVFKTLEEKWRNEYPNMHNNYNTESYVKHFNYGFGMDAYRKGIYSLLLEIPWKIPFANKKYDKITIETGVELLGNTIVCFLKSLI